MDKDIEQICNHSQLQLSTSSFKVPVCSYSASQISYYIKLNTTSVISVRYKKQNNSVLGSENSIQNDLRITNN